jgi:hypothetical protein
VSDRPPAILNRDMDEAGRAADVCKERGQLRRNYGDGAGAPLTILVIFVIRNPRNPACSINAVPYSDIEHFIEAFMESNSLLRSI